jgi:hypothetical protein
MDGGPKHIGVEIDSDYLLACARIRNITMTTLVRRLMQVIDRDQLVLAVLDDEDNYHERERYQHQFRIEGYKVLY